MILLEIMETLSERDIKGIIDYNQDLSTERGHEFDINSTVLGTIFRKVNNLMDVVEKRLRIIKKATIIFCEIAHCQPFLEGNRTTAMFAGLVFLRRHGFGIPLRTQSDKKDEIMELLTITKEKRVEGIEDKLCEEIEHFLIDKVIVS